MIEVMDETEFTEALLRDTAPQPDFDEIWEWAARNVNFGSSASYRGGFDIANVPWTKEIYRDFRDRYVREITVIMPPQESGKTTAGEVCLSWRIDTQPAKMAWNTVTNVKAGTWSETRWGQLPKYIPALKARFSPDRYKTKKSRVIFNDGTFLLIQGAEVDANRQSDSIEVQINDEVMLWDRPWLEEMHTRTRAYRNNRKILNLSLGGNAGSELDEVFHEGNQKEWCHVCPKCNRPFPYVFDHRKKGSNIRFDLSKVVQFEDGRMDLRAFEQSIYTFCSHEHCGEQLTYDPDTWARLNAGGVYVPMNPTADPAKVSIRANAFAIGKRPWVEILKPWVRLNLRGGIFNNEILRKFITTDLCEFWENKPIVVNAELKLGTYTRADMQRPPAFANGKCISGWADEWIRVMAVDNQRGAKGDIPHRWFVCRAIAKDGRSRLVDCGRVNEWDELQARARLLGVPEWSAARPGPWVVVDRAFDSVEVDEICARFKWYGAMGADQTEFVHGPASPYAGKRMQFSDDRYIDVGFGTQEQGRRHAIYFLWSSQRIQDYLALLRAGKAEAHDLPADLMTFCPEYAEHLNSHRQRMVEGRKGEEKLEWYKLSGWADHLYDCESEIVVLGLKAGVFKMPE